MENPVSLDDSRCVVVDHSYRWIPIDHNTPRGVKIQLINRHYGVANYGVLNNATEAFYTHWAPLPTFDKPAKAR